MKCVYHFEPVRKFEKPRVPRLFSPDSTIRRQRGRASRSCPMKPARFTYHAPSTVEEAVALLAKVASDDGRVLAGGQSLVPTMAFRLARPTHLVDINNIAALNRLAIVVRHIAHYPIRTRGTFCGSIANADPASEWCTVAVALDAEMVARSARGTRVIAAKDFFDSIMTTNLREDELLTEVRLPLLPPDTKVGFCEFSRRAGDFAIAMALATYRLKDGKIVEPRVAVGGAEPYARRIAQAEKALDGQAPAAKAFVAAAEAAAAAVDPMEDVHNSAVYRRELVLAMTRRALERAAA